jgi:glycosyltransferase involved in cell wall biosynthesis
MNDKTTDKDKNVAGEERPLVTFALFAYNQEKYIREAVAGALAQTYEPLEIILSDDCSTDRTFEIMQDIAAAYKGKHTVIVRQTARNVGLFAHVVEVAQIASGGLIVLAAGDDISKAHRVLEIVKFWKATGAWGISSRYDVCDAEGKIVAKNQRSEDLFSPTCELRRYFLDIDPAIQIIHGATSAYDIRSFDLLPKEYPDHIMSEDGVLSVFLNAFDKKCMFMEESLIIYRQHDGAITMTGKVDSYISLAKARSIIEKEAAYSYNMYKRAVLFLNNLNCAPNQVRPINAGALSEDIIFRGVKSGKLAWRFSNVFKATAIAFQDRRIGNIIPALIGKKAGTLYVFLRINTRLAIRNLRSIRVSAKEMG